MAFSSLNSFSASTGLGVSNKKTTATTYSSGLYYKGYTNNTGTYVYGVSSGNRYENALLFLAIQIQLKHFTVLEQLLT